MAAFLAAALVFLSWGPGSYSAFAEVATTPELPAARLNAELGIFEHELISNYSPDDPLLREKFFDYALGRILDPNSDVYEKSAGIVALQALIDPESVDAAPGLKAHSLSTVGSVVAEKGLAAGSLEKANAALAANPQAKDIKAIWDSFFAGSNHERSFSGVVETLGRLHLSTDHDKFARKLSLAHPGGQRDISEYLALAALEGKAPPAEVAAILSRELEASGADGAAKALMQVAEKYKDERPAILRTLVDRLPEASLYECVELCKLLRPFIPEETRLPPEVIRAIEAKLPSEGVYPEDADVLRDVIEASQGVPAADAGIWTRDQVVTALAAMDRLGFIAFHPASTVRSQAARHLESFQNLKKHLPQAHAELRRELEVIHGHEIAQDASGGDGLLEEAKKLWKELQDQSRTNEDVRSLSAPVKDAVQGTLLGVNLGDIPRLIEAKEGKRSLSAETLRSYIDSFTMIARDFASDQELPPILDRAAVFCVIFAASLADFGALRSLFAEFQAKEPGLFYAAAILLQHQFKAKTRAGKDAESNPLAAFSALREGLLTRYEARMVDPVLMRHQRSIARFHLLADPLKVNEIILKRASVDLYRAADWVERAARFDGKLIEILKPFLAAKKPATKELDSLLTLQAALSFEDVAAIYEDMAARSTNGHKFQFADLLRRLEGKAWYESVKARISSGKFPYADHFGGWKEEDLKGMAAAALSTELPAIVTAALVEESFLEAIQGRFKKGTSAYRDSERKVLAQAVRHNRKIRRLFQETGLDYEAWTSWKGRVDFKAEAPDVSAYQEALAKDLRMQLLAILGDFKNRAPGRLAWPAAKKVFNATIKKWHLEKDVEFGLFQLSVEGKLDRFLADFEAAVTAQSGLKIAMRKLARPQKSFSVRLWKRNPACDLFQGNFTACCIALGREHLHPDLVDKTGVIENYLLDTGVNIIEVVDEDTGRTVAQTFAFPAIHSDGSLSLVLDNIEIRPGYIPANREIRDNLFRFAKAYAKAFGNGKIKNVYLGVQKYGGPGLLPETRIRIPGDDIPTEDLKRVPKVAMAKFGGPLGPSTYLDAFYRMKDRSHDGAAKKVPLFVVP